MSDPNAGRPVVTAVLFALIGAWLLAGGLWLAILGGSLYYVLAGAGTVLVSWLLWCRRRVAVAVYALVWLGTLPWALYESGLRLWYLEPRLLLPTLLLIWLWLPPVQRRLSGRRSAFSGRAVAASILVAAGLSTSLLTATVEQPPPLPAASVAERGDVAMPDGDWVYYGRTPRGERYTPLGQITPANVARLAPAWTYRTGDLPYAADKENDHEFNFEATPIKVGDSLYLCTPHSHVIALDPVSGRPRWTFDPHADTSGNAYVNCRGVSYYQAPPGTDCPQRIFAPIADARLVALDARTGKPCAGFGDHGFISLTQYLEPVPKGFHFVSSPPLVIKDRVILGGWIYDGQAENEPSGAVRAFDPVTGALAWAWDVGVPGEVAHPRPRDTLTGLESGPVAYADTGAPRHDGEPEQAYPASKVAAEKLLQETTLNWSIIRFPFVYGDADGHLEMLPKLLHLFGFHPANRMSTIHHRDIATAMGLALKGTFDGRIINISDDAPTTIYELVELVGGTMAPSRLAALGTRVRHSEIRQARSSDARKIGLEALRDHRHLGRGGGVYWLCGGGYAAALGQPDHQCAHHRHGYLPSRGGKRSTI